MNDKLHAITDDNGRPPTFSCEEGRISDYTSTVPLREDLLKATWL